MNSLGTWVRPTPGKPNPEPRNRLPFVKHRLGTWVTPTPESRNPEHENRNTKLVTRNMATIRQPQSYPDFFQVCIKQVFLRPFATVRFSMFLSGLTMSDLKVNLPRKSSRACTLAVERCEKKLAEKVGCGNHAQFEI